MKSYAIVLIGSGLGGMLRHAVNNLMPRLVGAEFPWHTLSVNVLGSLAMGIVAGIALKGYGPSSPWVLFLTTGLLGGFTTFSAFSLDAVVLYQRGDHGALAVYVLVSVGASIAALIGGLSLARGA